MKVRFAFQSIAMFGIIALLTSCGLSKTLVIGVNDGYKPFGYQVHGQPAGFEVELWDAIAKEAGISYKLVSLPSSELLKSVREGKIDAAIAAISVKEQRKKSVDFSTAYMNTGQALMVRADDKQIRSINQLNDKTIGTKIGTSGYEYASKIKGIKEIKAYPSIQAAFKALIDQEVDAIIYDEPGLEYYRKTEGKGKVKIADKNLTKEHYAIALKKGSLYTGRVNNALKSLNEKGTFEKIYQKWFDEPPKSLPRD